jgi:hypothetical protein
VCDGEGFWGAGEIIVGTTHCSINELKTTNLISTNYSLIQFVYLLISCTNVAVSTSGRNLNGAWREGR